MLGTTRNAAALLAMASLASFATAQPAIGDPAPDFKIQEALGDVPATMAGLRGRAVLLDLFATW